jgi:protein TonB
VASAATELSAVREGANRSFGLALLASLLLHALLLGALPSLRELAAQLPPAPAPLIARLAQREAPPAPAAADRAVPEPAPPKPPVAAAKPPAAVKPPPLPTAQEPPRPPRAQPAPAPVPAPPAAPLQNPVASAIAPPAPAASGALARLEPQAAPAAPPGPDPGALERYRLQLVTVAARFKRYPRSAIDNNWEGAVAVRMTIGADGRIAELGVLKSSGHEVLDRQALDMFRTAKPFVQLPPELAGREFELELRAIYSLRDQPSG